MVALSHCMAHLAERNGDPRLVEPISVYRHSETGEIRLEPEPSEISTILASYTELVLFALRAGYISAYVDSGERVLSPEFWQYPIARECLNSSKWKDHKFFQSLLELNALANTTSLLQPRTEVMQRVNLSPTR